VLIVALLVSAEVLEVSITVLLIVGLVVAGLEVVTLVDVLVASDAVVAVDPVLAVGLNVLLTTLVVGDGALLVIELVARDVAVVFVPFTRVVAVLFVTARVDTGDVLLAVLVTVLLTVTPGETVEGCEPTVKRDVVGPVAALLVNTRDDVCVGTILLNVEPPVDDSIVINSPLLFALIFFEFTVFTEGATVLLRLDDDDPLRPSPSPTASPAAASKAINPTKTPMTIFFQFDIGFFVGMSLF